MIEAQDTTDRRMGLARTRAVRRLQFSAGHRIVGHEGACAMLHGHNWQVFLHAEAAGLDAIGRVIDFGVLKRMFWPWIEANWDHGFILNADDAEARAAMRCVPGQKVFLLSDNPTAENLAACLLRMGPKLLADHYVRLVRVELWETENGLVTVE